ncbi:MAG: sugar ABC transporter substrate-binding protein [Pseudonocardiales bacterium]|nr:MAG: sugar ABC transporter substrate-binding protein [Pseudonocardiales bacterium]
MNRRDFLRASGAMALAGVAAGPLLSSCSSNKSGGGNSKELSFWNFYGPAPKANPQSQWFVDLVAAWNKDNEVKVKLRYIPNADYISGNTLQTAFSSGSGPDIFLISPGDFLRYYNGKVFADLTSHIAPDARTDFVKGVLDTRMVDNKIFAVPMEIEPLAMYFSQQMFEQNHLAEGDIPKTWDQLLDVAHKLTGGNRFGVQFETVPGYYQNFTWYPFMWQGNGSAVDPSTKKSAFDSDAVVNALTFWQETQKRGVAPKKALGNGAGDAPANLGSGYTGMQQTGIWSVADLAQQKPGFKYDIFPLPTPPGGNYVTDGGGWAFAANAKGGNPEAAAKFITWALGSNTPDSIERGRQWNTVAKTNLPPRTSVQKAAESHGAFQSGAMLKFAQQVVPGLRSEPRYPPQVYKAVSDAIQSTQLGGANPKDAAGKAADTINSFLQGYAGAPIL